MSEYRGIMVFAEFNKDRILKNVSFELLSKACEIASKTDEKVSCVCFGDSEDVCNLADYGAEEVIVIKKNRNSFFDIEADTISAAQIIKEYKPSKVFFGATDIGRILAPKIAAELHCGITADCTEFLIDEKGKLVQIRPALGGNILAHIVSPDTYPQMATARPSVFKKTIRQAPCKIVDFISAVETPQNLSVVDIKNADLSSDIKIENASKIISVGIGVKQTVLKKVIRLSELIGATVACSRKVVEAGWLPHSVQVGQSGKTISPDLYLALGISGASQHLSGMKTSQEIIAVNSDPDADIFSVAHIGFAADVDKWLDAVLFEIEKGK